MALPPQKFREIVYQILFSSSFEAQDLEEAALSLMHMLKVTKRSISEAYAIAGQVLDQLNFIDEKISTASDAYAFDRISSAEKCALRLGVFELCFQPSLPPKVAIAESIRLTRKFGTPQSADFVNAILDTIYKNALAAQPTT